MRSDGPRNLNLHRGWWRRKLVSSPDPLSATFGIITSGFIGIGTPETDLPVRPAEVHKEWRVRTHGEESRCTAAKTDGEAQGKTIGEASLILSRLNSKDPAIRLQGVDKLPVVRALVGSRLWDDGIGHMAIARQESTGGVIVAVFLVDVFCLGVKNAFWRSHAWRISRK